MRLQCELSLPQARVTGIGIELTKPPKVTMAVRANLTREVAEAFGCRDLIYAGKVPRSGVDKMKLDGEELDCDVHFQHDSMAFGAVANAVSHFNAKMEGDGPKLLFRIRLSGYAITVAELAEKVETDPIEITLKPAQMNLPGFGDGPQPVPEPVEMPVPDTSDFLDELEAQEAVGGHE